MERGVRDRKGVRETVMARKTKMDQEHFKSDST